MDPKNKNFNKTFIKQNYQTLPSSSVGTKQRMTLSKFDLDAHLLNQHLQTKLNKKSEFFGQSLPKHPLNKKNEGSLSPVKGKVNWQKLALFKQDILETQVNKYVTKTQFLRQVKIDKSKVSSRRHGVVSAYAANSHPGPYNMVNQDRICIITNLNKGFIKGQNVQFFGIYDGNNGSSIADYMRDNFHIFLQQDSSFPSDIVSSIKNSIRRLQKEYNKEQAGIRNDSSVSFVMLIIIDKVGYCAQIGQPRLLMSRCLGKQLSRINPKAQNHKGNSLKLFKAVSQSQNKIISKSNHWDRINININIRKIQFDQYSDFILMGSSGVFQNLDDTEILKQVWRSILCNPLPSLHQIIGQSTNQFIDFVFHTQSTQNISLIIIAFSPLQNIFKEDQHIQLPYIQDYNE